MLYVVYYLTMIVGVPSYMTCVSLFFLCVDVAVHILYRESLVLWFVTVVVETPTKLTREQKELLKQLESSVGDDGQPKRKSFFDKLKG